MREQFDNSVYRDLCILLGICVFCFVHHKIRYKRIFKVRFLGHV